jgi:PhzF family phenazine biosynthesis protein
MPELEMWHVNVFSKSPFGGNPAAVGFCDTKLGAETMQSIARIMNLSESVFISSPHDRRAHYHARIFTTRRELSFAGHPTIAAAFAFIQKNGLPTSETPTVVRQECGIGIVQIEPIVRPNGTSLYLAQREPRHKDVGIAHEDIARALGCSTDVVGDGPASVASTGVPWLIVELTTLMAVRTLRPDFTRIAQLSTDAEAVGMTVFTRQTSGPARHAHLRTFAPAEGIYEDPVCGSCHGALAAHLRRRCSQISQVFDRGQSLSLEQGEEIGLPGFSEVIARKSRGRTQYLVGGDAVATLRGTMHW